MKVDTAERLTELALRVSDKLNEVVRDIEGEPRFRRSGPATTVLDRHCTPNAPPDIDWVAANPIDCLKAIDL
jgi:hypothetical protein